jgi:type II secretory pathway component PulF
MTTYAYEVADEHGAVAKGSLTARDEIEAAALLTARGLYPLRLRPAPAPLFRRTPSKEQISFLLRSLASLVQAGVPVDRALRVAETQVNAELARTLEPVLRRVIEGTSLSRALAEEGTVVSPVVLGMLQAGEAGSRLAQALEQAADLVERDAEFEARLRQALAYPIILTGVGVGSVAVILGFVLPRFADLLHDVGQELPALTRLLLGASGIVRAALPWVVLVAVVGLFAFRRMLGSPEVRARWHAMLLALPGIGSLRWAAISGRLARTLGSLLEAGVPVLSALDLAAPAAGDGEIEHRMRNARRRIAQGEPMAHALEVERVLTEAALQLVALGESNGQLAAMTLRAGHLATVHAERRTRVLVSLLEPGLVLFFAGLVALVAAALLQAVYSLRPS